MLREGILRLRVTANRKLRRNRNGGVVLWRDQGGSIGAGASANFDSFFFFFHFFFF